MSFLQRKARPRCRSSRSGSEVSTRGRRAGAAQARRDRRAGRVRALHGRFLRAARGLSPLGDRRRAGQGRRRSGGAAGLGRAHRRRPLHRHDRLRRERARTRISTSISASRRRRWPKRRKRRSANSLGRLPPRRISHGPPTLDFGRRTGHVAAGSKEAAALPFDKACGWPLDTQARGELDDGGESCDQRFRTHRPQRSARHRRVGPHGHRGRRRSTISARSRPTRICCASTACTAAFPHEVDGRRRHDRRRRGNDQGDGDPESGGIAAQGLSASTSRWNAPASSPRATRRPRI